MTDAPCLKCATARRIPQHDVCQDCHAINGPCRKCSYKKPGAVYAQHPRYQLALINKRDR